MYSRSQSLPVEGERDASVEAPEVPGAASRPVPWPMVWRRGSASRASSLGVCLGECLGGGFSPKQRERFLISPLCLLGGLGLQNFMDSLGPVTIQ